MKRTMLATFAAILVLSSCTETKTTTVEQTEIKTMDSTTKVIKENDEKLEEQTKKVEESLEKLDKEFENQN
jgi:hypothetical protein